VIRYTLTRYVVLPSEHAEVGVTLWIGATHAQPAWEHATRLAIKSPVKRCGKSRLLDLIEALAHDALMTVNISPAALVRSIGEDPPTLLLDEADTVFGTKRQADNNEDLRGLLNAGHQRGRPYVRWDMAARQLEECKTFAMPAMAAIGSLPDTIEDRAVIVAMRRRAPGEQVSRLRRRDLDPLRGLQERLHAWLSTNHQKLEDSDPEMPVEDRAADTWAPLVTVADLAGGDWPKLARVACEVLCGQADPDDGAASERVGRGNWDSRPDQGLRTIRRCCSYSRWSSACLPACSSSQALTRRPRIWRSWSCGNSYVYSAARLAGPGSPHSTVCCSPQQAARFLASEPRRHPTDRAPELRLLSGWSPVLGVPAGSRRSSPKPPSPQPESTHFV